MQTSAFGKKQKRGKKRTFTFVCSTSVYAGKVGRQTQQHMALLEFDWSTCLFVLAHTVFMYMRWPIGICEHVCGFCGKKQWQEVYSPSLTHHTHSDPLEMIINVIIKHLLPTAPALSLPPGPSGDPISQSERESERKRAAKAGGRDTGGARRRGWRARSSKSKGVIITLLDSFTPARACSFCVVADSLWSYVIPEQKEQGGTNNPMLTRKWRNSQQGAGGHGYSDIRNQFITWTWFHFSAVSSLFLAIWVNFLFHAGNRKTLLYFSFFTKGEVRDSHQFVDSHWGWGTEELRTTGVQVPVRGQNVALFDQDSAADEPVQRHHAKPIQRHWSVLQHVSAVLQQLSPGLGKLHRLQR